MLTRKPRRLREPIVGARLMLAICLFVHLQMAGANAEPRSTNQNTQPLDEQQQNQVDSLLSEQQIANVSATLADIVISSLEDERIGEKLGANSSNKENGGNERHHYEQQLVQQVVHSNIEAPRSSQEPDGQLLARLEPRNELESASQAGDSNHQEQAQVEPMIIDHRPAAGGRQEVVGTSTQSPFASSANSPSSPPTTSSSTTSPMDIAQQQQQQQPAASSRIISQWSQPQQVYFARSTGDNQQQQQFGPMMSGSNQIFSVQHPTSINSIISEQQSQVGNQQSGWQQQPANSQQASLILVGSPQGQNLALVPSGGANSQLLGSAQNGRRASISNWIRGLGSMLANIFNRREHGGLGMSGNLQPGLSSLQLTTTSGSSPSGHWIQLGPNAPHWLTQAQSALQQFQQKHQHLTLAPASSSRFAAFIHAAGPQPQTGSASNVIAALAQPQTASSYQQQTGDLQTSGSSNSYLTIQNPSGATPATPANQPAAVMVGQLQQQQQQQQQVQPSAHQMITTPVAQPTLMSVKSASSGGDQVAAAQASVVQQKHQVTSPSSQQQVALMSTITSGNQQQQSQSRFGRSSSAKQTAPSSHQVQQASGNANANLPLAHYSQYSE